MALGRDARCHGGDLASGGGVCGAVAVGPSQIFADRRPILIQAIPYILAFSIFFVLVGLFTRRLPDSAVLPMRLFIIFWTLVGAWSGRFILKNGMLYVSLTPSSKGLSQRAVTNKRLPGQLAQAQPSPLGYRGLPRRHH